MIQKDIVWPWRRTTCCRMLFGRQWKYLINDNIRCHNDTKGHRLALVDACCLTLCQRRTTKLTESAQNRDTQLYLEARENKNDKRKCRWDFSQDCTNLLSQASQTDQYFPLQWKTFLSPSQQSLVILVETYSKLPPFLLPWPVLLSPPLRFLNQRTLLFPVLI